MLSFQVKVRNTKQSFISTFTAPSQNSQYFFDILSDLLHYYYSSNYDNKVIDFNLELTNPIMFIFSVVKMLLIL